MKHWTNKLKKMNACEDAVIWAKDFKTFKEAWGKCERADWMLWLAGKLCKTTQQRKQIVLVACKCARRALKHVPKEEKRPLKAIQVAERWAKNVKGVTLQDIRDATYAAYAATYAADAVDAAYAAYAATNAAYTTNATADASADATADAAADAAAYAAYATADATKKKELKAMSKIIRPLKINL